MGTNHKLEVTGSNIIGPRVWYLFGVFTRPDLCGKHMALGGALEGRKKLGRIGLGLGLCHNPTTPPCPARNLSFYYLFAFIIIFPHDYPTWIWLVALIQFEFWTLHDCPQFSVTNYKSCPEWKENMYNANPSVWHAYAWTPFPPHGVITQRY